MIAHLRGRLTQRSPTQVVVDVGGVGYGLSISLSTYDRLPEVDADVYLFTYTYVREDRLELFGFADQAERSMFELLIGVSGIGPNLAQTILSGMSVPDLHRAIHHERAAELTAVRGIGRKTAERLVIELKDKLGAVAASTADDGGLPTGVSTAADEAVLALIALGIPAPAAKKAVASALERNGDDASVQSLIRQALQER